MGFSCGIYGVVGLDYEENMNGNYTVYGFIAFGPCAIKHG